MSNELITIEGLSRFKNNYDLLLNKKPGLNVNGETFTKDGTTSDVAINSHKFNDLTYNNVTGTNNNVFGSNNTVWKGSDSIVTGSSNTIKSNLSSSMISGTSFNLSNPSISILNTTLSGTNQLITSTVQESTISGSYNQITGNLYSSFISGHNNGIRYSTFRSIIGGSSNNLVEGAEDSIISGTSNTGTSSIMYSLILGNNNNLPSLANSIYAGSSNKQLLNVFSSISSSVYIAQNTGYLVSGGNSSIVDSFVSGPNHLFSEGIQHSILTGQSHRIGQIVDCLISGSGSDIGVMNNSAIRLESCIVVGQTLKVQQFTTNSLLMGYNNTYVNTMNYSIVNGDNVSISNPLSSSIAVMSDTTIQTHSTACIRNSLLCGKGLSIDNINYTDSISNQQYSTGITVLGKYNEDIDAIFIVGNGTSNSNRKNALSVDTNNNLTVGGSIKATDTNGTVRDLLEEIDALKIALQNYLP